MDTQIIVRTRHGKETHWGSRNGSTTVCGRWLKANGVHFEVKGATAATCQSISCQHYNPRPASTPAAGALTEEAERDAIEAAVAASEAQAESAWLRAAEAGDAETQRDLEEHDAYMAEVGGIRGEGERPAPTCECSDSWVSRSPEERESVERSNGRGRRQAEALGWTDSDTDSFGVTTWHCPACGMRQILRPQAHVAERIVEAGVWRCYAGARRLDLEALAADAAEAVGSEEDWRAGIAALTASATLDNADD